MQETLTYQADGLAMRSQLFFEPSASFRTGMLVFAKAFGLEEDAIRRAKCLAALGYAALACDLQGYGRVVDNPRKAVGVLQPLFADPQRSP